MIAALLGLGVAAAWLAALGLPRLPGALDRLHVVAFVNLALGAPVTLATFLADGASARAFKLLVLLAASVVIGAGLAHATGRGLLHRGGGAP
ncbi:MAG TPA: cation:proton antiporter [Crenalkalicoccus sp.]|nr:cation:proton antiporter [Crenalkalicoccus sp.]